MGEKIRVLLVEDEHWSLELLKGYIEKRVELELMDVAVNGNEALALLNKKKYGLVFLDINLPGINGIKVLNSLNYLPNLILVTVKKDFALKAFEIGVVDYLLKPISNERFNVAVDRVLKMQIAKKEPKELPIKKPNKEQKTANVTDILIHEYELTPQEATISGFLLTGLSREDIIDELGITKQTMKQHLRVIYSKTIDFDKISPNKSHGKLHILMNFLHRIDEEEN
ncbi:MAG: response regulator [Leptospirales bacterium]